MDEGGGGGGGGAHGSAPFFPALDEYCHGVKKGLWDFILFGHAVQYNAHNTPLFLSISQQSNVFSISERVIDKKSCYWHVLHFIEEKGRKN